MGTGGPRVPGPTLFLLLVLPPSLMSKKSFLNSILGPRDCQHRSLNWGSLHGHLSQAGGRVHHYRRRAAWQNTATDTRSCQSIGDLYFVLDMTIVGTAQSWYEQQRPVGRSGHGNNIEPLVCVM
uniref:Uncharacterized protein n=1 Tax=Molossus molossus TaxID=27622 RepID=A0A7J8DQI6_MOLMO|nr:hypothetical protein HJG59_009306 [Molossus molossus]